MFNKDYMQIAPKEYDLIFNGKHSKEFQLGISKYPSIPRIKEDVEDIEIQGRSGTLTINNGTYGDRIIIISFKSLDIEYFWSNIEVIEKWLTNIKNPRLFYDRVDKCFKVKRVEIGDISKEISLYGEFEVTFICEPFMIDLEENCIVTRENIFSVENRGDFEVEPYIKLEGSGDLILKVNGEKVIIKGVDGYVIINSNLMICYKEGENMLLKMQGDFPILKLEENIIEVSDNVDVATIKFNNLYR